jgi:hypothetical protein
MSGIFDKMIKNLKNTSFIRKTINSNKPYKELTEEFNQKYEEYQRKATKRLEKDQI